MSHFPERLLFAIVTTCGVLFNLASPEILDASKARAPEQPSSTASTRTTHAGGPTAIPSPSYRVLHEYPHDRSAFTQGLVFENGYLYEGTGLNGHSSVRKVALETGKILQRRDLPAEFFGEGITIHKNKIIQLTWQSHVGFVYDKETFELMGIFSFPTEGWGITHDEKHLIMSDGTATLHFLNPETFEEVGRIQVHDDRGPVPFLNELEYVRGKIFANVWQTSRIARISPETGKVVGWINLEGLLRPEGVSQAVDVLNGIAYDTDRDRLFVTGKFWPRLFEIELIDKNP